MPTVLLGFACATDGAGESSRHWSFTAPRRADLPEVQRGDWARNGIDRFILARLEREGIAPSPEADKHTLIRRVTLDLTGLPPTPEQVDAFVADDRPDAYERLVDRLLDSPHYGERWARPWLDLCHYADTDGYLTDQLRPVAWRHREWVVEALNADMPFDRFTIEQLAGDLLPDVPPPPRPSPTRGEGASVEQRIATGFLRHTLSNREGGADLEEFRDLQVLDRTSTVGTVWLGLTVGCAQCHDHKYDPLSQRDFYELYAFFNTADEVNLDAPLPEEREAFFAAKPDYQARRQALIASQADAIAELQRRWELRLLQAANNPGEDAAWDRYWELLGLIWGGGLGEGQLEGTEIVKLDPAKRTQTDRDRILDYFLQHGAVIDSQRFAELKLGELRSQLEALKAGLPKVTRAPTMRAARNSRPTHVHVRGDFREPGEPVGPDTPACLPPLPDAAKRDRLALARWLVAPENPLTARVAVNRMWQEFFGRGLVETSDDFGTRGAAPSHPELLDWLAVEFMHPTLPPLTKGGQGGSQTERSDSIKADGAPRRAWSTKRMHRLIVTSATYRQSSKARPNLHTIDPQNRLLARQSSLRLSAEAVRDSTLAVSGLLSRKIGGPSVFPPQPERITMEAFGSNEWNVSEGADRCRRGLYTFLIRTAPFAQGATFDAPNPNFTCTRRERSNTPLQALTLLNDPVFFEAAQALGRRILREQPGSVEERIEYAFRLCLGRTCSPEERSRLLAYLDEQRTILSGELEAAEGSATAAVEGAAADEEAVWTGLASVMLNLHEFITRD